MHRLAGMPSMRWDVMGYFVLICFIWGSFLSQAKGTTVGDAGDISYNARWENCFRRFDKGVTTKNLEKVKAYYDAEKRDLNCANGDFVIEVAFEAEQVQCDAPSVDRAPGQEAANIKYSGVTDTGGPIFAAFEKYFPLPPRAQVKITKVSGSGVDPQNPPCYSKTTIYELAGSNCKASIVRPVFFEDRDILNEMNKGLKLETDLWHSFRVDTECDGRESGKSNIEARVKVGGPHTAILPMSRQLNYLQMGSYQLGSPNTSCLGTAPSNLCKSSTLEGAWECIREWISWCDGQVLWRLRTYPGEANRYTSKSCANSMHRVFDLRADAKGAAEVGFKLPPEQQILEFYPNLNITDKCTESNLGLYLSNSGCERDPNGEYIKTKIDNEKVFTISRTAPMSSKRYLHLVSNDPDCHFQTTGNDPAHTALVDIEAGTEVFGLTLDNGQP